MRQIDIAPASRISRALGFICCCTKIHQILATVMERELFSKYYLKLMEDEEESLQSLATEKMLNYNIDVEHCQDFVVSVSSMDLMKKYENFFCD